MRHSQVLMTQPTALLKLTFLGLDDVPMRLRNGTEIFSLQGSDIVSRGKALGIPLGQGGWWINVHLRMHAHVTPAVIPLLIAYFDEEPRSSWLLRRTLQSSSSFIVID